MANVATIQDARRADWFYRIVRSDSVKKYYKKKGRVELRPAHAGMVPISVKDGDFRIAGKVVGVLRYYE